MDEVYLRKVRKFPAFFHHFLTLALGEEQGFPLKKERHSSPSGVLGSGL
jgi:hypothetical protein